MDSFSPQQNDLAMLIGPDITYFQTLVNCLMFSDNEVRSQAEDLFDICKQKHPDVLCLKLFDLLQSSPHVKIRAMSAILLRIQLTRRPNRNDSYIWPRLSEYTQSALKSQLLDCVSRDDTKSITKKLCDTVSELASGILSDGEWPELLPFMLRCFTSDSPKLQESVLLIFAQLSQSQYNGESLIPQLFTLHEEFFNCLSSSNLEVRIASMGASINFIQCLSESDREERDKFQNHLPLMMTTLTEALNCYQVSIAQEALVLLIDLAGTKPKFLRGQLVRFVELMLQICESESLEDGIRHLAIEFFITLIEAREITLAEAESASGMMREWLPFIRRLFEILMKMLLDIKDDNAWHTADSEEDDESSNYSVGQECLNRLSISLGENTIVLVALEVFQAYLAVPEWREHHAVLIALTQIAEGCSKIATKMLKELMIIVLKPIKNPDYHSRVRWAAINAVGQLSTKLGLDLQVQYHQQVLPALASAMDDTRNYRVQAHAASAVLNFSKNCTPDILTPYLDTIVVKLLGLLKDGKQMVQENALTALASVADSSQKHFEKFYDKVMPHLKDILMTATDKSNRMLRAKSMECISLVGMAVGKDKFSDDSKKLMEVLKTLQGSQMETDDPTTSYMLQAWARLCKCLGQDFLPYMSVVMPPLLQSAQLKPDVTITSADEDMDISDDERIGIIIRTSVLEEKATACNMLCCYADELKEGFYPWIDQVATTLVPLLKFYFHEEVRKAAVSAMPALLRSAKLAIEKGQAPGHNESHIKKLSDYIIPALAEASRKEPEAEICASMLDALNEWVQGSGPLLEESQVRCIVDGIKNVITASSTRKRERAERAKAEDFDAEEGELLKEENEQEEEVFDQVGDCLGTLIKIFKASFLPFFDELSSYITPLWEKDKTAKERRIAIGIFNVVAEQCQEAALKCYGNYLPFLLEACNDENPDVSQAALNGIGLCAEFGGSVFRPFIGEALIRLVFVIRHHETLHTDNLMTYGNAVSAHTDNLMTYGNAVSALGKMCQFHRDDTDAAQVVPAWLGCLPIKGDLIKAKLEHDQLCSMVETSDRELLGPNNKNLHKIHGIFFEVLNAGKDLATEQTASRMKKLLGLV